MPEFKVNSGPRNRDKSDSFLKNPVERFMRLYEVKINHAVRYVFFLFHE